VTSEGEQLKGHHKLEVWKRSIEFVTTIYKLTENFPKSEVYGLVQQMRKSAVSIPSNIAEGAGRNIKNEFKQFLSIAQGSTAELETQILIARNLGFIEAPELLLTELDELSKMLIGLARALKP
jgi:four helix bundle protein